jgi:hypothetical protein
MQETNELSQRAGEGQSPEDQIRGFVRVFVGRLIGDDPNAWIHRLMAREMEHPTEALDLVMTQVVQPRLEYLCGVAGPSWACRRRSARQALHRQPADAVPDGRRKVPPRSKRRSARRCATSTLA